MPCKYNLAELASRHCSVVVVFQTSGTYSGTDSIYFYFHALRCIHLKILCLRLKTMIMYSKNRCSRQQQKVIELWHNTCYCGLRVNGWHEYQNANFEFKHGSSFHCSTTAIAAFLWLTFYIEWGSNAFIGRAHFKWTLISLEYKSPTQHNTTQHNTQAATWNQMWDRATGLPRR